MAATTTTTTAGAVLREGAQVEGGWLLNGFGGWYVSFPGQDISRTGFHATAEGAVQEAASVARANADRARREEEAAARAAVERAAWARWAAACRA